MRLRDRFKDKHNPLNLPNCLTFLRLCLIPFLGIFLSEDGLPPPFERDWMFRYSPGRMAALVVLLAGITDLLDGWLARKWKIESLLGQFLDPVADKVLLLVSLVLLMQLGRVEPWLVILLLSRELLVTALRGVAAGEGIIIAAGQTGKFKLIFQLAGVGFLMWYGSIFGVSAYSLGRVILFISLGISLVSGYSYLHDFFLALSKKRTTDASH